MSTEDEELIRRCRLGDEAAWEEIVSKYQNLLYSIPRRVGIGKDIAADILQDVFITLYEKLDKLEKPQFLKAWLVTTTRHKTMHLFQREKIGKYTSIDNDDGEPIFHFADKGLRADDALIRLETESQIDAAFAKIDDRCRKLLTMLYVESDQLPYSDIAEILGLPLGSIGPTRARCLQKLIKHLP